MQRDIVYLKNVHMFLLSPHQYNLNKTKLYYLLSNDVFIAHSSRKIGHDLGWKNFKNQKKSEHIKAMFDTFT